MVQHSNTNVWKVIAIIFISLFVLETIIFIWLLNLGNAVIANEDKCAVDVCNLGIEPLKTSEFDSYSYNDIGRICYCYKDGEIKKQKYMG